MGFWQSIDESRVGGHDERVTTTAFLHPDRLLPADPAIRSVARGLYERVATAPILSPHGHVPAAWIADDVPFADPAQLFIAGDHYVHRLLHASGVRHEQLGLGGATADPRAVWALLAEHWHRFAGTASGYWINDVLGRVFDLERELSPATADDAYDRIAAALLDPGFRPRALLDRFGIEVLATTDDPLDPLDAHRRVAEDPAVRTRVLPTFRPDAYLDPEHPAFVEKVQRLLDGRPATWAAYLEGLAAQRARFIAHGAVSVDIGVIAPTTLRTDPADAQAILQRALAGEATEQEAARFRAYGLYESARQSTEDGLVLTVHSGVRRNHHAPTLAALGPDGGHDIPLAAEYTENLRPLLEDFGLHPALHLVLFAMDETLFSRELAPLAGFYPSVFIGAPWWFLDAPDSIQRFRAATTETAGFYRGSGFIDDTRAFLSIPARHDMARRSDAAYLARLVAEGRVSLATAERIADDLVDAVPRTAFKL